MLFQVWEKVTIPANGTHYIIPAGNVAHIVEYSFWGDVYYNVAFNPGRNPSFDVIIEQDNSAAFDTAAIRFEKTNDGGAYFRNSRTDIPIALLYRVVS